MKKRLIRYVTTSLVVALMIPTVIPCKGAIAKNVTSTSESIVRAKEAQLPITTNYRKIAKLPNLPATIKSTKDIAPKGYSLLDTKSNDFNGDGLKDIIGVLEHSVSDTTMYPRILFIYFNNGDGYNLNLMNPYLIRNADEGGIYGDPYEPLTANKNTFTTTAYGGSAWRWSEIRTFEFKDGQWYLLFNKDQYGYDDFETSYKYDNFQKGIGLRRYTEQSPEKKNPKQLRYYVKLDNQPTLEDFAYTVDFSEERIKAPEIKSVGYNNGIAHYKVNPLELSESNIIARDTNNIVYAFNDTDDISYIGVYSYADGNFQIIARYDVNSKNGLGYSISNAAIYKDRLYYVENVTKKISVREDGKVSKKRDVVAMQLVSSLLDGSDRKVIFKVNNPQYKEGKIYDYGLEYFNLDFEISGDEIVANVNGGSKNPYYRMNLQGEDRKLIGSVPKGDW
jgi:hypothetical protein